MAAKPKDIRFPPLSALSDAPPFVAQSEQDEEMQDVDKPPFDQTVYCPVFEATGSCKAGLKCRFLGGHARRDESGQTVLVFDEEKQALTASTETEVNFVDGELLKQMRTKKVIAQ